MTIALHPRNLVLTVLAGLLAGRALAAVPAETLAVERREWNRFDGWEVSAFTVTGVPPGLVQDLRAGLEFTGRRKLLRGLVRPDFNAAKLLKDVRRTRLFMARNGYPASQVEVRFDIDERGRRLGLLLAVEAGPAVTVERVELRGWPDGVAQPEAGDPALPTSGDRFADTALDGGVQHLQALLLEAGFAEAKVEADVLPTAGNRVALVFTVVSGDFYTIEAIAIRGCSQDLEPVARRILAVAPGTDYRAGMLTDAAQDLRTTQLFRQVELTTTPSGQGALDLDVLLADARMRSWEASVGSWTDNPWMVRAAWTHRNALSRGRGLRVSGVYATHDQRLGAELFTLGWLSPRAMTSLGGEWIREDEDAYLSNEYAARLQQSFRPRGLGIWQFGVGISNQNVITYSPDITDVPESQDWLLEIYADRKWDWTDNLLYPTRGGFAKVSLTWAPAAAFFGASYVKAQTDAAAYVPLTGRLGWTTRLRLGWSEPLGGNEDLLANRRFYAGGYNTMRGYERRKLGPRDAEDNPRGGQATVLAGTELRFRLLGPFDGAFFVDCGDVWRRPQDAQLSLLRTAVGADLDVRTPLGPLRLGHAWNIGPVLPGEPEKLWHFGIGYPW